MFNAQTLNEGSSTNTKKRRPVHCLRSKVFGRTPY